ncbi:HAD family hydrolase [Propionicicella superfundia]|uniref:HAD family hydrolase n=1 Tax=Propionicicella superfundia TaxID=348582 RepID=UPI0004214B58|nr:HAD family hydrolase [Propionicicella superfundia]
MIRLVATDLDGTLLRSDKTISVETYRIVHALVDSGVLFVPASGRQFYSMTRILRQLDFAGTLISANGANAVTLPDETVRFSVELQVEPMRELVGRLKQQVPTLKVAAVRDIGRTLLGEYGYVDLMRPGDHDRGDQGVPEASLAEVLSEPSVKVVARAPGWTIPDLYELARSFEVPGVNVTDAGAPFIEILGEGVTKQSGLQRLCDLEGIDASEVMAFGDWINDIEMLRWAGTGVAVANAHPDALAAADAITASNDADGVAQVLAELLESVETSR